MAKVYLKVPLHNSISMPNRNEPAFSLDVSSSEHASNKDLAQVGSFGGQFEPGGLCCRNPELRGVEAFQGQHVHPFPLEATPIRRLRSIGIFPHPGRLYT